MKAHFMTKCIYDFSESFGMEELREQGVYKHYKGNYYIVLGIGKHTETGE